MNGIGAKGRYLTFDLDGLVKVIGIAMAIFQLYTAATIPYTAIIQRAIHLGFALSMVFFVYPFELRSGRKWVLVDIALLLMAVVSSGYIILNFYNIALRTGIVTMADMVFGTMMIVVVLEGTRRALGLAMPIIALVFLLYARFGYVLPQQFGHRGYGYDRIINTMFLSTEGIWGTPLAVSATFVSVFVIFGTVLHKSGGGDFFFGLADSFFGHVRGGPAKVAIVASGFLGMMSGSVVANVVTSGSITIPTMIRNGFSKEFAGGVEATASTGGVLMPPLMGAAAFIIAEILGIPYWEVAVAAIVPAILFYGGLFTAVDARAKSLELEVTTWGERKSARTVIRTGWMFVLPIVALVYMLGWGGVSELRAAFYAFVTLIAILVIFERDAIKPGKLLDMLAAGGKGLIEVALACACAGLIVGVFALTGLGLKISSFLVLLSGGHLIVLLFLTMVVCIILGMGVTPSAAYIVLAVLAAPALIQMGVVPIAAHLFILYFAIYANITPPVAVGAYAAAAISKGNPHVTGLNAFRLSLPGMIVPFSFAYHPALLLRGSFLGIGIAIVTALLGVIFMAFSLEGYLLGRLSIAKRIILFVSSLLLIIPGVWSDLIGVLMVGGVVVLHYVEGIAKERKATTRT